MLIGKKEFIAGLLIATISMSAATKLTSLYATTNKFSSEIKFSQKMGLFDSRSLSSKTLRSNIAEIAFNRSLNLILANKGMIESFNLNKLEAAGITKTSAPMGSLTRQKAAETIIRAIIYAKNKGVIKFSPNNKKVAFKDWVPDEKYQAAAAFAIEKGIFKGTGRNNFKPNDKLSVREALIFLKRLHSIETIPVKPNGIKEEILKEALERAAQNREKAYAEPDVSKYFKDIKPDNPMNEAIKRLINFGAFDKMNLNHELNLPKSIKNSDFAVICKSMLEKMKKSDLTSRIDSILPPSIANEALSRNSAAQIGAVMIDAYPHKDYNIKANYADVSLGSKTEAALKELSKAGIRMGYPDGTFKGKEKISRFEAFSLLNTIIGDNFDIKSRATSSINKTLANSEFDEAKAFEEWKKSEEEKAKNKTIKLEQQLNKSYKGLSFRERIELRKSQFKKILNRESTR